MTDSSVDGDAGQPSLVQDGSTGVGDTECEPLGHACTTGSDCCFVQPEGTMCETPYDASQSVCITAHQQ